MRSPNRLHDRESFFKYMTADTACAVLKNRSLRWSSPILFNDPFDVPRELSFGITPDEIVQALGRKIILLIDNPPEDATKLTPDLRRIIEVAKKGISPELKAKLISGLEEFTTRHHPSGDSMDELRNLWRSWLPHHRILCLTESPAHTAMWYHYADKYCGIVLEFKCIDELDSAWLIAKPVEYPESKPEVYTAEGWAELLCMEPEEAIKGLFDAATYTKSPDWSYESEWRIASFKRSSETGHFTDYKFDRQELNAIYFGPMISSEDRRLLSIAAGAFPSAQLWNVEIGMNREFRFHET